MGITAGVTPGSALIGGGAIAERFSRFSRRWMRTGHL
jgi:hypothetical protein